MSKVKRRTTERDWPPDEAETVVTREDAAGDRIRVLLSEVQTVLSAAEPPMRWRGLALPADPERLDPKIVTLRPPELGALLRSKLLDAGRLKDSREVVVLDCQATVVTTDRRAEMPLLDFTQRNVSLFQTALSRDVEESEAAMELDDKPKLRPESVKLTEPEVTTLALAEVRMSSGPL